VGEAVPLFEGILAARERLLSAEHPGTLASRTDLAGAYSAAGRLGEAVELYERRLAESERLLGPAHPQVAVALYRLGTMQAELGDLASARTALGRAVEVDTAAYGPDHPEVATDMEALAAVQERQGTSKTRWRAGREPCTSGSSCSSPVPTMVSDSPGVARMSQRHPVQ
jgi:tetratricopeptide (TPR) repeat protein